MLDFIKKVEKSNKIRIVTIEFEIICAALDMENQSAGELFSKVRSSNASFYSSLKKLTQNNILVKINDDTDKRIHRYSVNYLIKNQLRYMINEIHKFRGI